MRQAKPQASLGFDDQTEHLARGLTRAARGLNEVHLNTSWADLDVLVRWRAGAQAVGTHACPGSAARARGCVAAPIGGLVRDRSA